MKLFGLIGNPLTHSYSEKYFIEKFKKENISDCEYRLFPIKSIAQLPELLKNNPDLLGLNVTTPFKKEVLNYIDEPDIIVKDVESVNTIKIENIQGKSFLKAYNTDIYGFYHSFQPLLKTYHKKALLLGTGGGARAVEFILQLLKIEYLIVSRTPSKKQISYNEIDKSIIQNHQLIINATPVGTFPNINQSPEIPYQFFTSEHLLFDLVYNPSETEFLKQGKKQGAKIQNGMQMLKLQADKAWELWNK